MNTDDLIGRIVAESGPVRPLPSPPRRAVLWFAVTLPCVAAIVLIMGLRPDLAHKLADPRFQTEQLAALATAIAAALAAFSAVVPGRPRWILLVPLLPLGLWLGSLGQDCIRALVSVGPEGLRIGWDWVCIPAIAMVGAVPAVAIVVMLRRGAPILPCTAVALGALAAGAIGNFGLRLFHPQDAGIMVLIWQFGTVMLLTVLAGCAGRRILAWRHARPASRTE